MARALRILIYVTALVCLFAALYGASHLLGLLLATLLGVSDGGDTRQELSLYLAALLVGLPPWLGVATAANRRAGRTAEERDARERRLFLAVVFAATSLVALFALRSLLRAALTLPGASGQPPTWRGAIDAGSQFLIYGAAWLHHARAGWAERSPRAADLTHDLAVYVLAGSALACLVDGLFHGVWRIVDALVGGGWSGTIDRMAWGDIAASVLAGGAVWGAIWCYDLRRAGRRTLRVWYLYLVLGLAVPTTLWGGAEGLYEALHRLLGYRAAPDFLRDMAPTLAIGGAVWAYHWCVVRAQAAQADGVSASPGSIAWPRRPAVALLTLLGHAIAVPGAISLLWLGLDVLFNPGLHGSEWWRDRLSGGLAAAAVGGVVWLGAWAVLQRAARASPMVERTTKARHLLLGGIVLTSALPAAGFGVALLWLLLRTLLGERLDSDALSSALKYLSAAAILLAVAVVHALLLRVDLRLPVPRAAMPRLRALVAVDAAEALLALRRCSDRPIEVIGQLSPFGDVPERVDVQLLQRMIATLGTVEQEGCDSVLVLVRSDGGSLLRYTSAPRHPD